ncbi:hypothetical protein ACFQ05_11685 [Amycolatopsis umgeniensis]|uniref:Uncharacterized protein n=1 Tax=Amycolatopsis umgeniensis TaxID=336628 RepID=A0A841B521_9PSEU|nr:hypothetical protein [Amycolatopsis umgeniensis]MBB5853960.1 hypothetical protein [Amycolatopsis umgeniensis]
MTVRAWLSGRPFDLEIVAHHFGDGDPAVISDEKDIYYLTSGHLDGLFDMGSQLFEAAKSELNLINGITRLLASEFQPVDLTGRFEHDGKQHAIVFAQAALGSLGGLTATAVATGANTGTPRPSPASSLLAAARKHPDATEVLALLSERTVTLNWFRLYKVFEIIRENVGGKNKLVEKNWKSRQEISAFTVSANSPHVSGGAARHARMPPGSPQQTMTIHEGRAMIADLLVSWLKWLAASE